MSGLQQALANEAERNRWMTEEQRRQAAAQRCADLANEASYLGYVPTDFTEASGANKAFLNAVLQLDELARKVVDLLGPVPASAAPAGLGTVFGTAIQYILPDPVPTPVERLAQAYDCNRDTMQATLEALCLELREKKP